MYRKTYALIDCDVLEDNIKEITNKYDYKYYIGVVKANAYGHGDYVINSLINGGINYLAASSLEECLSIRKRNLEIPILCLEPINVEYLNVCISNNITITIPDMNYFKLIDASLNLKVHIKIDGGMNRLGFKDKNEVKDVFDTIKNSNLYLEGVYTHFATGGIWDKHWDDSLEKFKDLTSLINLNEVPIVHLGRSLTLVTHPKIDFANGVRLGIIMFGFAQKISEPKGLRLIKRKFYLKMKKISPTTLSNDLNLKTAFSLKSEIMLIKDVKAGEYVGYRATYTVNEDMKIGIVPIGFADGYVSAGFVTINNKQYPVIGDLGMDMITVKIDDTVNLHSPVILYDNISKVTKVSGLSAYQLFTRVTTRVPRIYKEENKLTEVKY